MDAYTASKGGVIALTKAIAIKYGSHNIRANVIAPGGIYTHMSRDLLDIKELREALERNTPIPRIGKPEDIAYAALHLASDESSFTTGLVYVVDGGASTIVSTVMGFPVSS